MSARTNQHMHDAAIGYDRPLFAKPLNSKELLVAGGD
jgi:hypothetical protein